MLVVVALLIPHREARNRKGLGFVSHEWCEVGVKMDWGGGKGAGGPLSNRYAINLKTDLLLSNLDCMDI